MNSSNGTILRPIRRQITSTYKRTVNGTLSSTSRKIRLKLNRRGNLIRNTNNTDTSTKRLIYSSNLGLKKIRNRIVRILITSTLKARLNSINCSTGPRHLLRYLRNSTTNGTRQHHRTTQRITTTNSIVIITVTGVNNMINVSKSKRTTGPLMILTTHIHILSSNQRQHTTHITISRTKRSTQSIKLTANHQHIKTPQYPTNRGNLGLIGICQSTHERSLSSATSHLKIKLTRSKRTRKIPSTQYRNCLATPSAVPPDLT